MYLIFFGKSQDFVFHAFDKHSYIANFNEVIKDFDELESKVFTVDDVSNKQMLSKYVFEKNGKMFSLLKLYSLAQAFDGSRIGGSIYGVGLLSENDVKISDVNLSILNSAKKSFAQLSLDGAKFKSSNFYAEAEKIWRALLNQNGVNYFDRIESERFERISVNNKVKAFLVKDILKNPIELNGETENTNRLYFSDDFAHLKRTQARWGKDVFPIYLSENGRYTLYHEPIPVVKARTTNISENVTDLKIENGELKRSLETIEFELTKKHKADNQKNQKIILGLTAFSFIIFVLLLWNAFSSPKAENTERNPITQTEYIETQSKNKIYDILSDSSKIGTLGTLITNIGMVKNRFAQKSFDVTKHFEAIKRDVEVLGLELNSLQLGDTTNLIKKEESPKSSEKKKQQQPTQPKTTEE